MLDRHKLGLLSYCTLTVASIIYLTGFRWLKEAERKLDAGDIEGLRQEERRVSNIIQTFSADWKKSLDQINGWHIITF